MRMKPPSGPKKQTQFKACPERSEFTLSVIEGNGPISSKAKIACQKIRPQPLREDICKIFESWYYGAMRIRAYPNNRVVMRPSEKFEAKAAGQKCSEAWFSPR